MADNDPFKEDDERERDGMPRPEEGELQLAFDVPEPPLTPPDIELELESAPIEPLLPPELAGAVPQDETLPFPVDDPAERDTQQGGEADDPLVAVATRIQETLENMLEKMEEISEKLDGVGTFGP